MTVSDAARAALTILPVVAQSLALSDRLQARKERQLREILESKVGRVDERQRRTQAQLDRFEDYALSILAQAYRTPQREKCEYLCYGLLNFDRGEIVDDDVALFQSLVDQLTLRHVLILREALPFVRFDNGEPGPLHGRNRVEAFVSELWQRVQPNFVEASGPLLTPGEALAIFRSLLDDLVGRGLMWKTTGMTDAFTGPAAFPTLLAARFLSFISDPCAESL